ncbi:MAG TPA: PAN domain-containing protein [Alphaproteobacteria bacterium]|nr:PAN domain-containing protein [Alphaproteobacteria bacterium]
MVTQRSLTKLFVAFLAVLLAANIAWTRFLHAKAHPSMDDLMYGVYLQGNDLNSESADDANSEEQCSNVCQDDARCKAMSFVESPWGGGVCRIKDKVGARTPASNAISAIKRFPW